MQVLAVDFVAELVREEVLVLLEAFCCVRVEAFESLLHSANAAAVDPREDLHHAVEVVEGEELVEQIDELLQSLDTVVLARLCDKRTRDPVRKEVELLDHCAGKNISKGKIG